MCTLAPPLSQRVPGNSKYESPRVATKPDSAVVPVGVLHEELEFQPLLTRWGKAPLVDPFTEVEHSYNHCYTFDKKSHVSNCCVNSYKPTSTVFAVFCSYPVIATFESGVLSSKLPCLQLRNLPQ